MQLGQFYFLTKLVDVIDWQHFVRAPCTSTAPSLCDLLAASDGDTAENKL